VAQRLPDSGALCSRQHDVAHPQVDRARNVLPLCGERLGREFYFRSTTNPVSPDPFDAGGFFHIGVHGERGVSR